MAAPAPNVPEYTVSGISAALKRTVEDAYGWVRVRGEISGYKGPHSSGHAYFTLKDDKARLDAVVWRTSMLRIRFKPEEGLEVIATGKLSTFPGKSNYQMIIETLEPAGVGALMALLEERRKRLAGMGLFDAARKRPLPFLPRIIGVVTSPSGAVIRDILHRLADRCPTSVILWPVRVQGETAAEEVAAAIAGFNAIEPGGAVPRPDLLIIARGGGSLEDLWPFNEEIVVHAAAQSAIPLISAIGHETDTTLLDLVADVRAPTPTGAAEIAVPVRSELVGRLDKAATRGRVGIGRVIELGRREVMTTARALPGPADILAIPRRSLDELSARLGRSLGANALAHRGRLDRAVAGLAPGGLMRLVEQARQRLSVTAGRKQRALEVHAERKRSAFVQSSRRLRADPLVERLAQGRRRVEELQSRQYRAMAQGLAIAWQRLEGLDKLLDAFALSKESILSRGYVLVHRQDESIVARAADVPAGGMVDLEFTDGRVAAIATGGGVRPKKARRRVGTPSPDQGSLFEAGSD